jgi:hypothetical protein
MFIYKYNSYTKKYYKYDTDDVDLFSPMFDESIHDNDIVVTNIHPENVCVYCNTGFTSRNKLFHHLAYMNINTKNNDDMNDNMNDDYESDKGDYGYEIMKIKKKNIKRRKQQHYWIKKKQLKKQKRSIKKNNIDDITNMLNNKLVI